MEFSRWIQSHRRSILFLLAAFGVGGFFCSFSLPVSLFPRVSFPRVVVNIESGDRPAERMAIEVTWPVEEAVRSVPGVLSVRSATSRGAADISINFEWGQDMVSSMLQVESAVNQIMGRMPAGTSFNVRRMDTTVFPVLGYSLTSDTQSLVELRDIALYQVRPVLSSITGVARVEVLGGKTAEYQVIIDPAKLDSLGLSLEDVAKSLSAANVLTAVGKLEENYRLYLIVSNTQLSSFEQIGHTILRSGENGLVKLDDIATVKKSTVPQWTRVTADGHDAVIFQIYQQPGGNTVAMSRQVISQLDDLKKRLPHDIQIANWYNQSNLIISSAASVRDAVIVGIILAAIIIFVFLRNLKVTLIASVSLPMVLASTILLLSVLKMSFNIMTLGGMAAAVGLILDDAIVMVEHIIRRLRTAKGHYRDRVMAGAREFSRPLAGSSLSTVIIFAPLAFLSGVTGAFFKALSLTMAAGLIISYFDAWLAVPLLALHLLKHKDTEQEEGGRWTDYAKQSYERLMKKVLCRPALIVLPVAALLSAGWFAYTRTGSGFMPKMDEGGFILDYVSPFGTSLTETDRLLRQVEKILENTKEVETYSRRTGLQLGGGLTETNTGDFFVRLKPYPRRGIEQVMDDVRRQVHDKVPGLEIEMLQLMEDFIGDLTAVPQPIEIKLFSDDNKKLMKLAPQAAAAIEKVRGVVDVKDGIVFAGDSLNIQVDREKAALEGIEPAEITSILEGYLTGLVTTEIQKTPKMVGVRVWIPREKRSTIEGIDKLRLRAADGHLVPLNRVAVVTIITGQPEIMRDNLKQMIAVTGRISGRDMGSTIKQITGILNRPGFLPSGVYYTMGGLYQQQRIAFRGLTAVFLAAVVLVFVLLLFLYESFRVASAMLITTLFSLGAVFIGLWITGTELNITAIMGMTMIVGIVTEVMIFYYSEFSELANEKDLHSRLILAGKNRMRPITMTTLATILALMPLALGIGEGSAMLQPLAIAIISGLTVQLPLVLIVQPILLMLFRRLGSATVARNRTN
jgi:CzcA family heavy metal efflux pump